MHNAYINYAFRESSSIRSQSADHPRRHCGRKERNRRRRTSASLATGRQPRLQRARDLFSDELLIRSARGFEPTPRCRKILQQLETLLPAMESLVSPAVFDPRRERSHFRISGPDNVCAVLLPRLCRRYVPSHYRVTFDFFPWQSSAAEMLEHNQVDLILSIDDGLLASHFQSETLYREDWICAVSRANPIGDRLTLKQYVAADHLTVATLPGSQTIPDKQLAALGLKRRSSVRMPYFAVALECLSGTDAVLTLTSGMRTMVEQNPKLRLVEAPKELRPFHFQMVWHPRLNADARHAWLREAIQRATKLKSPSMTLLD
jgi:DNA-binding transcriptional LysR family regulator